MVLEELSPRAALPVGLLALFPLIWYALGSSVMAGIVSTINVLLILACLYVAFSPVGGHSDAAGA
ncbi:cytochrome-ba3 oxidase subunit [Natrarchaeobius halalkaliphilus]|uniref:Cytochrome-ba3 oxidase subunit n=1 Tax=Natrarchaeobius halalkaliphilus TaxID=1679091 RepID=A0A3N6M960_9EURY|nr:cytochrome-ba3 oxidase subunit [Natrarchaeobius halalkaliphilus]RQG92810.1 cytochrome-ba3 oxidase subunit [Natrarchaeobius halalkaliphilus]